MKPSDNFTNLIISFEGEKLVGYRDSAGLPSIGVGHLILKSDPYKVGKSITQDESRRLLAQDSAQAVADVNKLVKVPISQNQFDALVSLVFNIGGGAFAGSSVLKYTNLGQFQTAANHFLDWNKARVGGKLTVVKGLVNRRNKEKALFLKS